MTFGRSFENFVQILSEEEVTPEITPSALADISKEYSPRSLVAIISNLKASQESTKQDELIPIH